MARVSFHSTDGEEKTYKLIPHRAMKIGRDPGNDIVLRDAKASRVHAEIVYEKGFFVVHDLASANGTFVNGQRIRVAPLTDGAELKLGNSYLRFTEEIKEQAGEGPEPRQKTMMAAVEPYEQAADEGVPRPPSRITAEMTPQPMPKPAIPFTPDSEAAPSPPAALLSDPSVRATLTPDAPHPLQRPGPPGGRHTHPTDEGSQPRQYRIELMPQGELAAVRDESSRPLYWFRPQQSSVRLLSGVLGTMILLSGLAAVLLLALQSRLVPAAGAFVLTLLFTSVVFALAPKRFVVLYRTEQLTGRALSVMQENRPLFGRLRFRIRSEDGSTIAKCERSYFRGAGLARQRWWILDGSTSATLGFAQEKSLARAWARKLFGLFVAVRASWNISLGDRQVASIFGRDGAMQLELSPDAPITIDRRIPLGVAVLVSAVAV